MSSLAFYSYIVTLGIWEQRKASFSPYPHRSEFWVTLSFLRDDRTRLIYVLLEHLVECFLVAVGQLWSSRLIVLFSSLKKFCPISSRLSHFPSRCSRYAARFIPCFYESFPLNYNPFCLHH